MNDSPYKSVLDVGDRPLKFLLGMTITEIRREDDRLIFKIQKFGTPYGTWCLRHDQECCERVWIEDIDGDLQDLVGHPLLVVSEERNQSEGMIKIEGFVQDTYTWTFYKFATVRGSVTIRFYGGSNGCYAEDANLYTVEE